MPNSTPLELVPPPLPTEPQSKFGWLVTAQKQQYQLLGSILATLRQTRHNPGDTHEPER